MEKGILLNYFFSRTLLFPGILSGEENPFLGIFYRALCRQLMNADSGFHVVCEVVTHKGEFWSIIV